MDDYPSTNIYTMNTSTGSATALVATGSGGLRSLVAERTAASVPSVASRFAVADVSSSLVSTETLLKEEEAFEAARSADRESGK
jgi:hypothetical protein